MRKLSSEEIYTIDLKDLEKAKIIYDRASDSLHIIIDEEEADKALLLENNIVVRIKDNRIIEIEIQDIGKLVQE
ncbi:MAG: DUF2283 domain-containing protein [Ignisphaera sp.]